VLKATTINHELVRLGFPKASEHWLVPRSLLYISKACMYRTWKQGPRQAELTEVTRTARKVAQKGAQEKKE
jgi:hypothetical protein